MIFRHDRIYMIMLTLASTCINTLSYTLNAGEDELH